MSAQPDELPDLKRMLLLFAEAMSIQVTHSLFAAAKYKVPQRLARWLLMCHDRTDGDEMSITHEFLTLMLAVRRSSVSTELAMLEGEGLIKATRGLITIRDRQRLEDAAGGSYGIPEHEYRRLFSMANRKLTAGRP